MKYVVTITPITGGVGAGVDAHVRLRQWLKMGLRAFGLRCIDVVERPADGAERATIAVTPKEGQP